MKLFKRFSRKNKCTTCKFNMHHDFYSCNVGSHYAETKGTNVVCNEGELWESDGNESDAKYKVITVLYVLIGLISPSVIPYIPLKVIVFIGSCVIVWKSMGKWNWGN